MSTKSVVRNDLNECAWTFLESQVRKTFPAYLTSEDDSKTVLIHIYRVDKLPKKLLMKCLDLVDQNLGEIYAKTHGSNWKTAKLDEMKEAGLVYTVLQEKDHDEIAGFLSMKLVIDYDVPVIYLYEIQLNINYREQKFGSKALKDFIQLPNQLNANTECCETIGPIIGTALTVFGENARAYKFYRSHGYVYAPSSPRNHRSIDGSIVKPEYYILIKYANNWNR